MGIRCKGKGVETESVAAVADMLCVENKVEKNFTLSSFAVVVHRRCK